MITGIEGGNKWKTVFTLGSWEFPSQCTLCQRGRVVYHRGGIDCFASVSFSLIHRQSSPIGGFCESYTLPVLPRLSLDRHQFPPSLPSHDFGVAEQRRWQFSRPLNQLRRLQVIGADAGSVVFFYPRRYVETLVPRTRRGFAWSTVSAFSFALRFLSLGFTQFYFDLLFFSAQHPSVLDRFSCEITYSWRGNISWLQQKGWCCESIAVFMGCGAWGMLIIAFASFCTAARAARHRSQISWESRWRLRRLVVGAFREAKNWWGQG